MIALRQKRAMHKKAHQARVNLARRRIAIAKKQGWWVRGKSWSFWASNHAFNLKRQWIVRKRQQQARARAQRQKQAAWKIS
jgi:hypothetical protein